MLTVPPQENEISWAKKNPGIEENSDDGNFKTQALCKQKKTEIDEKCSILLQFCPEKAPKRPLCGLP